MIEDNKITVKVENSEEDNKMSQQIKKESSASDEVKDDTSDIGIKDKELSCSLPLSLEIPEVNVNPNVNTVKEIKEENNLNNNNSESIKPSNSLHSNLLEPPGLSPFISNNVHNFSFNPYNLKGKNLFFGNNFESPYRRNQVSNQFSPSPLTIKVANSASINKSINEMDMLYQNYQNYSLYCPYNYSDNHMVLNADSNMTPWNSRIRPNMNISNSPLLVNKRNLNLNFSKNENVDILSYLNNENLKEIKEKENVKIKLCKNEKLIKSMFDIKEESMCSSEENSRKFHLNGNISGNNNDINNVIKTTENNYGSPLNTNSVGDSSSKFSAKYKLDGGKLLNNISYTLYNVNADIKICPIRERENIPLFVNKNNFTSKNTYTSNNNGYNFAYNNYEKYKPKIMTNFLRDDFSFAKEENPIYNNNYNNVDSTFKKVVSLPDNKVQCNCKKSKCLKLYCECFSNGDFCQNCNCTDCHNIKSFEEERKEAIELIKEKNPIAFQSKLDKANASLPKHSKGCNCTKSNCMKKYCECFQIGIGCSDLCRCKDCKNAPRKGSSLIVKNSIIVNDDSLIVSEPALIKLEAKAVPISENKQPNINSLNPQRMKSKSMTKLTNKKRNRKMNKTPSNKKDNNTHSIISLMNKINSAAHVGIGVNSALPLTTPKKQQRSIYNINDNNSISQSDIKREIKNGKSTANKTTSRTRYKDTILSHMITTAPTSTNRRSSIRLNVKDFDKSIVKKLNMNVDNEPLFGNKISKK